MRSTKVRGTLHVMVGLLCTALASPSAHAQPAKASAVPAAGYVSCASDGETCTVPAGKVVNIYYGAGSSYVVLSRTGTFVCSPDGFKISDPAPNVTKTCWVNHAGGWPSPGATSPVPVASATQPAKPISVCKEGSKCAASSSQWGGVYGAAGAFVPIIGAGPFTCALATFKIGDPAPNVAKSCYVAVLTTDQQLDVCRKAGAEAANQNRRNMSAAVAAQKATAEDQTKFANSQASIASNHGANKSAGYTLEKCWEIASMINDEAKFVASVDAKAAGSAAPPAPPPPAVPPFGSKCADEGGTCRFSGTAANHLFKVSYGAGDKWFVKDMYPRLREQPGDWGATKLVPEKVTTFSCNNATFGDPAVGKTKACYIEDRGLDH